MTSANKKRKEEEAATTAEDDALVVYVRDDVDETGGFVMRRKSEAIKLGLLTQWEHITCQKAPVLYACVLDKDSRLLENARALEKLVFGEEEGTPPSEAQRKLLYTPQQIGMRIPPGVRVIHLDTYRPIHLK
jgi:hypothetical protein